MGEVIRFVPKSKRERARLIREDLNERIEVRSRLGSALTRNSGRTRYSLRSTSLALISESVGEPSLNLRRQNSQGREARRPGPEPMPPTTAAPQPKNTKAKVPINSASCLFIGFPPSQLPARSNERWSNAAKTALTFDKPNRET